MKLRRKVLAAVSSLAVLAAVLLAGCATQPAEGNALKETGILTLSVNPEIQIEYNKEGRVTALSGQNEDGKGIVASYQDYIGKDCSEVLQDLIVEINEAGYFVEDVDGNQKNIVLQLEPGSVLPSSDFLANMSASTQDAVKGLRLSSGIVTIDDDDYDPAYVKDGGESPYITLEKAKEIALTQANVSAADAVFEDKEFDHDDGTPVFELEFVANGVEYEYDVHAVTGKILRAEHKTGSIPANGTAGYNDTDYGPGSDGVTDYTDTDYGPGSDGVTDYNDTDYGPGSDGVTDYNDTDYGPGSDGVTDYTDTDYGPGSDGVTDYTDTDYGPGSDGVTDYNDTDYGSGSDGVTNYGNSNYDDGGTTNYGNSGYGNSNYDDGGSNYDDGDSGYDD